MIEKQNSGTTLQESMERQAAEPRSAGLADFLNFKCFPTPKVTTSSAAGLLHRLS